MKRKVKICMNQQCESRINKPDAAVCMGCKSSFRGINWQFLDDAEIERILNPEPKAEEEDDEVQEEAQMTVEEKQEYVVCPSCGARVPYRVGLEECDCGEYIGDIVPCAEEETAQPVCKGVTSLRSLDGRCHLPLDGEWIKIGRLATGKEYFESAGKRKVSREHAILRLLDGAWYISYCKREDRNYSGGVENPIFINKRRLEREENYRLQLGDEIGFAEFDTSDTMAAFFRAE